MQAAFNQYLGEFMRHNKDLRDRIFCIGYLETRETLYDYYRHARILAVPSRSESFGIATLEGASFGDVIIGSDIPSIREITNQGKLAYLCPVDDVKCFGKKLRHMLTHPSEIKEMSERTRRFVRGRFDWTRICYSVNDAIQSSRAQKSV